MITHVRTYVRICHYGRVTSQGSAYPRFRRALAAGNLTIIRAEAAELPYVELDDALRIAVLMAQKGDRSYELAACRWLARFALERGANLRQLREAVEAFEELPRQADRALPTLERLNRER
jgi:hypothetical protein